MDRTDYHAENVKDIDLLIELTEGGLLRWQRIIWKNLAGQKNKSFLVQFGSYPILDEMITVGDYGEVRYNNGIGAFRCATGQYCEDERSAPRLKVLARLCEQHSSRWKAHIDRGTFKETLASLARGLKKAPSVEEDQKESDNRKENPITSELMVTVLQALVAAANEEMEEEGEALYDIVATAEEDGVMIVGQCGRDRNELHFELDDLIGAVRWIMHVVD
jgi:hypothetical protein